MSGSDPEMVRGFFPSQAKTTIWQQGFLPKLPELLDANKITVLCFRRKKSISANFRARKSVLPLKGENFCLSRRSRSTQRRIIE